MAEAEAGEEVLAEHWDTPEAEAEAGKQQEAEEAEEEEEEASMRYRVLRRIGQGSFGEISVARERRTERIVALKEIQLHLSSSSSALGAWGVGHDGGYRSKEEEVEKEKQKEEEVKLPRAAFREMQALRQLNAAAAEGSRACPVVRLWETFARETALVLVMEYMPSDLAEIMHQCRERMSRAQVRFLARGVLEAVAFCHGHNVLHRDIKPSNILLSARGEVKLGDFGLARIVPSALSHRWRRSERADHSRPRGRTLSHEVYTRWYRPPELLFGSTHYSAAADIFSTGLVIAELLNLSPLFPGTSDIDQLLRVLQVMGTPTEERCPQAKEWPDFAKLQFPEMEPVPLRDVVDCETDELHLLNRMLLLNPDDRALAGDLLADPYFTNEPHPEPPPFYPRSDWDRDMFSEYNPMPHPTAPPSPDTLMQRM